MRKIVVTLASILVLGCGGDSGGKRDAGPPEKDAAAKDAGERDAGEKDAGPMAAPDATPAEDQVDPKMLLTALSSELRERVCSVLTQSYDRALNANAYLQASCTLQAWPLSWIPAGGSGDVKGDPDKCKPLVAMCLEQHGTLADSPPAQSLGADLVHPTRCTLPPEGIELGACDATVGDLESCTSAAAKQLGPQLEALSCDLLSNLDELQSAYTAIDLTTLPECAALREHCMTLALTLGTEPDGQMPSD